MISTQLITACKARDRRAQHELYKQCFGILMGVCRRYTRQEQDAVSLVNAGYFKVLTQLEKYKTHVPFEAWVRRIMINTCIDEFRKNKRRQAHIDYRDFQESHEQNNSGIDLNEADLRFDAEAVEQMIRVLPEMTREVFNLFAIDGYSHKEIAAQMGISVGTSKWHVSTARKKLKKMMNEKLNKITSYE